MKKIIIPCVSLAFVIACSAPTLTPSQSVIRAISDTGGCEFVKSAYMESRPSVLQEYLKIQTEKHGGNAYKVISTSSTVVTGADVVMTNYDVYKCPVEEG